MEIGVIGTGVMGQHHARNYAEMEDVELVGLADTDKGRVGRLAKEYGTTPYTDYKDLLSQKLDAVSIAVPTTAHEAIATKAIDRGINVLVEKPISDKVNGANVIIKKAEQEDVKLMVGHIERFNPATVAIKKYVDEGKLGKVVSISTTRVGPFNPRIRDVGVILDLGVHDIDLLSYIYSENITSVFASAGSTINNFEDYASMLLTFNNGNSGIIKTNWLTPHKVRKLTITGTKGIAYVDNIKPSVTICNGVPDINLELDKKEPLRSELEHFITCIREDRTPLVNGEAGRRALNVALAAVESYKTRRVVSVS